MAQKDGSPFEAAVRALRRRDRTAASLAGYLERRGVSTDDREAAIARVRELGYLDDARFASRRAESLAGRGCGNALIASDLERRGVARVLAAEAIAALEPEAERAARIVARRSAGPATWRYLAGKGYSEDVIRTHVAESAERAVG